MGITPKAPLLYSPQARMRSPSFSAAVVSGLLAALAGYRRPPWCLPCVRDRLFPLVPGRSTVRERRFWPRGCEAGTVCSFGGDGGTSSLPRSCADAFPIQLETPMSTSQEHDEQLMTRGATRLMDVFVRRKRGRG